MTFNAFHEGCYRGERRGERRLWDGPNLELVALLLAVDLVPRPPLLLPSLRLRALLENRFLVLPHSCHKVLDPRKVGLTVAAKVSPHGRKLLPVDGHDEVDGAFADLQRRRVRQEIVARQQGPVSNRVPPS